MEITESIRDGLNTAFNEADLLGFELDADRRLVAATVRVLCLPDAGPPPEDRRVQLLLHPVGRVAASLRNGHWDDPDAEVVDLGADNLLDAVQSFGGLPIYGWKFFDNHQAEMKRWGDRLSMDWRSGPQGLSHSLTLFQDTGTRIFEICAWFDNIKLRTPTGADIDVRSFINDGVRWWDGLHKGDSRTDGHGIIAAK